MTAKARSSLRDKMSAALEREITHLRRSQHLLGSADPALLAAAHEMCDGDVSAATRWLATAQPGLGGKTPLVAARTKKGVGLVRRLVAAIEYGVYL